MRSGGRYKAECVRRCSLIYVGGSKTQAGKDRVIPLLEDAVPYVEYFHGISQPGGQSGDPAGVFAANHWTRELRNHHQYLSSQQHREPAGGDAKTYKLLTKRV